MSTLLYIFAFNNGQKNTIMDSEKNDNEIKLSQYKISSNKNGIEDVEFELISSELHIYENAISEEIRSEIDQRIEFNNERLENIDKEIDRLTSNVDKVDVCLSVASGFICGLIDSLYVGAIELDLENGTNYDDRSKASLIINKFIEKVAKGQGYTGEGRLEGAIGYLERFSPVAQDNIWKQLGISSTRLHHLEDIAHHPTPMGLAAAICVSLLQVAIFTDKDGKNHLAKITGIDKKQLVNTWLPIIISGFLYWLSCLALKKFTGRELSEQPKYIRVLVKVLSATPAIIEIAKIANNWALHEVSDIGGSKNTAGGGMGIPGLFISFMKEIAMFPPFDETNLNAVISDCYSKNKMDFRSELIPMMGSLGKQIVPVVLNEVIISGFYFTTRLIKQYKLNNGWIGIDWVKVIPYGNRTIVRMRTISSGVFTAFDIADAAIRAKGVDTASYIMSMALRINIVGVGKFIFAIGNDVSMGLRKSKMRRIRSGVLTEQIKLVDAKFLIKQYDTWVAAKDAELALIELEETATQSIQQVAQIWGDIRLNIKAIVLPDDDDFNKQLDTIL